MARSTRLIQSWMGALLALSCTPQPARLGWGIDFRDDDLRSRATLVEAQVRRGGCEGRVLFSTRVSASEQGQTPASLSAGRYGFYARARDASCVWFAAGCTETQLPSSSSLTVVLQEVIDGERDPTCVPGEQSEDPATAPDGGAGDDAGREPPLPVNDAGSTTPARDGGAEPSAPDAQVDASEPAPLGECAAPSSDVVACYDFDGRLSDASSFGNGATGSGASFELLGDDSALRAGGSVVSVPDDDSLDLTVMTLEVWLRVDSLVNLSNDPEEMTIVVDKDQQYIVGFNPDGAPVFQNYDPQGNVNSVTGPRGLIEEGKVVYLASTYDGMRAVIYVDGVQVDEEVWNEQPAVGDGTMHIGTGSPSATRALDGLIDALRMSNRARSAVEICAAAGKSFADGRCE